jgi:hypothetical protein
MKETAKFIGFCVLVCGCLVALIFCSGCGSLTPSVTYNITFHGGAFRVADELTVEPGQGGDDSSQVDGSASGGTELSPGANVVIRGFADQGNIFNIGTSQPSTQDVSPDVKVDAKATVNSPGSTTGSTGGGEAPPVVPTP